MKLAGKLHYVLLLFQYETKQQVLTNIKRVEFTNFFNVWNEILFVFV